MRRRWLSWFKKSPNGRNGRRRLLARIRRGKKTRLNSKRVYEGHEAIPSIYPYLEPS